ncbi:hypothetical protein Ancab_021552 [Ancistrocladus abbreviatus]
MKLQHHDTKPPSTNQVCAPKDVVECQKMSSNVFLISKAMLVRGELYCRCPHVSSFVSLSFFHHSLSSILTLLSPLTVRGVRMPLLLVKGRRAASMSSIVC